MAASGFLWRWSHVVRGRVREASVRPDDEHSGDAELVSPMPGSVVAVGVDDGSEIVAGTGRRTVEAMKMEHALPHPSTVWPNFLLPSATRSRWVSRWPESPRSTGERIMSDFCRLERCPTTS